MRDALTLTLALATMAAPMAAEASSESKTPTPSTQELSMSDSLPQGFLATPASGCGPGVLVLHAWWGLNDTIRDVCRRLAEAGYVAYAPDLFGGQVAATIPAAEALSSAAEQRWQQIREQVAEEAKAFAARDEVSERGLGVMGYSFGASYALFLSDDYPERIRATVVFYGSWADGFARSRSAYLGHFAEDDPYEDPSGAKNLEAALKKAGRPVTIHDYPGTKHWFVEPDRVDSYDAAAATLAWERTLAFLGETLGPGR